MYELQFQLQERVLLRFPIYLCKRATLFFKSPSPSVFLSTCQVFSSLHIHYNITDAAPYCEMIYLRKIFQGSRVSSRHNSIVLKKKNNKMRLQVNIACWKKEKSFAHHPQYAYIFGTECPSAYVVGR